MPETSDHSRDRPVAAQYIVNFLKPEMLHIYRQVTALRAYRPVVFCQKRENATTFPFADVVLLGKPRTHQLRRLWQKTILRRPITIYGSEARRIREELQRTNAQLLHIYFGHIGVHLLPLLENLSLPVIVSFHGADTQEETPAAQAARHRMFDRCTLVLARSASLAARLAAQGCDPSIIRIHRAGIPLEQFPFTLHTPPADGAWNCLQASRLIPKKGLVTSLRAFARFAESYPAATFTIAGEGPLRPELQSVAGALGIGQRVRFTGFANQSLLQKLYREAHFFLHPSESTSSGDQEGVPNGILEAMASGVPSLATRHGGIPEAIEDGVSGLLTDEGDFRTLAEQMLALACNDARYAEISSSGSKRVCAEFKLQAQTRTLERLYSEAIAIRRGA